VFYCNISVLLSCVFFLGFRVRTILPYLMSMLFPLFSIFESFGIRLYSSLNFCSNHLFSHKSASSILFIVIHPFIFSICFPNIHPHIAFHGNFLLHEDGTRCIHSLISICLYTKLPTLSQAHQFSINTPSWLQGGLRTRCYIRSWPCCTSVGGESCVSY
jgi:hypothetical protein